MHDDGGERRVGQGRVEVPGTLGPGIRGQRPELAVDRGVVIDQEHLREAARDAKATAEQAQLGIGRIADRGARCTARGEGVVVGLVSVGEERVAAASAGARWREGVGAALLEIGEERVARGARSGRGPGAEARGSSQSSRIAFDPRSASSQ